MNTIHVRICLGTTCYVMGASNLQSLAEELPPSLRGRVDVQGAPCLGFCKDRAYGKAPYVCVGDRVIAGATPAVVIQAIEQLAAGCPAGDAPIQ